MSKRKEPHKNPEEAQKPEPEVPVKRIVYTSYRNRIRTVGRDAMPHRHYGLWRNDGSEKGGRDV